MNRISVQRFLEDSKTGWRLSFMKQLFIVNQRYIILQETEKTRQILNRQTLKHVTFLRKYE